MGLLSWTVTPGPVGEECCGHCLSAGNLRDAAAVPHGPSTHVCLVCVAMSYWNKSELQHETCPLPTAAISSNRWIFKIPWYGKRKIPVKLEKQIVYFFVIRLCALYDVSQYIRLPSDWYIKNKILWNVWTEMDIWTIIGMFTLQIWFYMSLFPAYLHISPRLLFESSFFPLYFPLS